MSSIKHKKKPTGFVATCQCGNIVGALDYGRTHLDDAGKIIGGWLHDGCSVSPRFTENWSVICQPCKCGREAKERRAKINKALDAAIRRAEAKEAKS